MNKLYLLAAILLVHFSSCSTRIDLFNPATKIPVVYLQVNPNDSMHYLTLTRTFSGEVSAFDIASDADQVFYNSCNIRLEGWIYDYRAFETYFEPSEKTKTPGIFPVISGYCFELSKTFLSELITSYRLVLDLPGMSSPAFSKIEMIGPPIVKSERDRQISLYGERCEIGIAPGPGSAYCDLVCVFRYQQLEETWINHVDTFCLRKDINYEAGRTDYLYPEVFFNKIAANIKPVNDTIVRKFTSLDLTLYAGDQYFRDYIDSYQNAGDHDIPPKGNINNGLGLFTMLRSATKENMKLDSKTHDSLCMGQFTRQLGFVRW